MLQMGLTLCAVLLQWVVALCCIAEGEMGATFHMHTPPQTLPSFEAL